MNPSLFQTCRAHRTVESSSDCSVQAGGCAHPCTAHMCLHCLGGEWPEIVTYQQEKKEQGWKNNSNSEHFVARYIDLAKKSGREEVDLTAKQQQQQESRKPMRKSILGNERVYFESLFP